MDKVLQKEELSAKNAKIKENDHKKGALFLDFSLRYLAGLAFLTEIAKSHFVRRIRRRNN